MNQLRVFLEATRLRGIRWAVAALFGRFVFSRRALYVVYEPTRPAEEAIDEDGITFGLAAPEDLERLRVFEPYVVRSQFREWLGRPDTWVVVALDKDRPVGFRCDTSRSPRDRSIPRIALGRNQFWNPELYVLPEHRRHHLSLRLSAHADGLARARGFDERVFRMDAGNYPQLKRKLSTLLPGARVQHVRYLCVLRLCWRRVDPDGRRRLEEEVARLEGRSRATP